MVDPVSTSVQSVGVPQTAGAARRGGAGAAGSFATLFREQLEQVSRMQSEADQGVQGLLTGQQTNLTEVFTATRKAEVAFSLLMEIRNKLVDAYTELKRMQV